MSTEKKKIITQKRIESWVLWLGYIAAAFLAVGIDWQDLNSWKAVWDAFIMFASNPAKLIAFGVAMWAITNNPTNKSGF